MSEILPRILRIQTTGEAVEFTEADVDLAASLFKMFLRDLPEPLLTFDTFDRIVRFHGMRAV